MLAGMDLEVKDVFGCKADFVDDSGSVKWVEVGKCNGDELYDLLNCRNWKLLMLLFDCRVGFR